MSNDTPIESLLSSALARNALDNLEIMNRSVFWTAFWTGLAGPAMLYADPPTYYPYLSGNTVAWTFSGVARSLDHVAGLYWNVGYPSTEQSAAVSGNTSSGTATTSSNGAVTANVA